MKRTRAIVTRLSAAPLRLRLLGGFALVLAVSAGQTVFAYRTAIENSAADESVGRGEQILGLIAETRTDLLQMEAGYSGYSMATKHSMAGRHTFLDSYAAGARAYGMDLRALEGLTAGDAGEQARWHDLEWRAATWQRDVIEPTIAGNLDVSSSASQSELQLGDMERILGEATAVELAHQSQEHQWTVFTDDRMRRLLLWGTVAVVGVGVVVALLFARALARALAQVRAGERRYRQMFVNNPAIKLLIDPSSGAIVEANQAACDFYGYLRADLLRRPIWDITTLPKHLTLESLLSVSRDVRTSVVSRHRLASGEVRDVEVQASPVEAEAHGKVLVYAIVHDITERKHAEEALRHQALHDELTGLPNRTLLQDRLSQAILAARRGTTPLTLLLVDLDRFKEINDTFGHHHGDLLLQQIGPRLRGVLRESDTVARLGGDEFGILLPTTDAASAVSVSQQLLRILEAPFELDGQSVEIGASIGIASYPAHGSDAATLLRGADVAMYVAKRGESGVVVYAAEQDHYSAERLALGGELRRALENGELLLHYQPKLDMRDGSLVGVEALVRWKHPLRGFLRNRGHLLLQRGQGVGNHGVRGAHPPQLEQGGERQADVLAGGEEGVGVAALDEGQVSDRGRHAQGAPHRLDVGPARAIDVVEVQGAAPDRCLQLEDVQARLTARADLRGHGLVVASGRKDEGFHRNVGAKVHRSLPRAEEPFEKRSGRVLSARRVRGARCKGARPGPGWRVSRPEPAPAPGAPSRRRAVARPSRRALRGRPGVPPVRPS